MPGFQVPSLISSIQFDIFYKFLRLNKFIRVLHIVYISKIIADQFANRVEQVL